MTNRTDAERRHHRERVIARRLRIVRDEWAGNHPWLGSPGRFAKYNLVCSCGMCRDRKARQDRPAETRRWRQEVEAVG